MDIDLKNGLHNLIEVKSYTFKRLVIGYGQNKTHNVSMQWKSADNEFHLSFGTHGLTSNSSNPHSQVETHLRKEFNKHRSVAQLIQVLNDTVQPLTAISRLNCAPMLGHTTFLKQPLSSFSVIPQSPIHYRVAYRNFYCIDIHCRGNKLVAVRDGAYSMFDTSKAVDGFNPIPGLKTFLNMFVDETVMAAHQSRRRSTTEDDNPPSPIGMDTMESFMSQSQIMGSPASRQPKQDGLRFHSPMTPPSNPHTPASPSTARLSQPNYSSSPAAAFPLASPPSLQPVAPTPSPAMMGTPSPGQVNLHVPSPGFVPTPSPQMGMHMPSPANPFIGPGPQSQGMAEAGSPYPCGQNISMPSPGQRNWPGSPSVPGPSPATRLCNAMSPGHPALHSPQNPTKMDHTRQPVTSHPARMLPQRSWAASKPTLLSHEALSKLLSPTPTPGQGTAIHNCSPLEKFFGSVYMRRHLQRLVLNGEGLQGIPCNEPGIILFKGESLQYRAGLNLNTFQMLNLKVSPLPEYKDQWSTDELQVLEKYFEIRVAGPPYKPNALSAFARLLAAAYRILKDCVQLLRLELVPDRSLKWNLQWCLTICPASPLMAVAGTPAVVIKANKILIMLQLTRIGGPATPSGEPQSVIVPLLYDTNTNNTTLAEQRATSQASPPANMAIINMLKRFSEFNANIAECSLYPAVRELLANLVVPI